MQALTPHLNLGTFLNRAPMTVRLDTPAIRVHAMFVSLSLRWVGGGASPIAACCCGCYWRAGAGSGPCQ